MTSIQLSTSATPVYPNVSDYVTVTSFNTTNTTATFQSKNGGMSAGAIAGVVICACLLVVAVTIGSFLFYRWRNGKFKRKGVKLPTANLPSRESLAALNFGMDVPHEQAPPRPAPPKIKDNARPTSTDSIYEEYMKNNTQERPLSYETPVSKACHTRPAPPVPKKLPSKINTVGKVLDSAPVYDDPKEENYNDGDVDSDASTDSYEIPEMKGNRAPAQYAHKREPEPEVTKQETASNISAGEYQDQNADSFYEVSTESSETHTYLSMYADPEATDCNYTNVQG